MDANRTDEWCWCVLCVLVGLPPDTLQGHRDRFLEQFKKYDTLFVMAVECNCDGCYPAAMFSEASFFSPAG